VHGRLTALQELLRTPIGRRLVWTIAAEAIMGVGILGRATTVVEKHS
jgi:hypothetical protein